MRPSEIILACRHDDRACEVVLPGRPGPVSCCDTCWNAAVAARKAQRRKQLDAMPRCEACRKHRGTMEISASDGRLLLCGRCLNKAQAARMRHAARLGPVMGSLAAVAGSTPTRSALLRLATQGDHEDDNHNRRHTIRPRVRASG